MFFRLGYSARRRFGFLRRATPALAWAQIPPPTVELKPCRRPPALADLPGVACREDAQAICRGEFRLFSHQLKQAGFPPDWRRNQLTGEQVPAGRHWTELGSFAYGDIKGVWELSRFTWAFALVRAHARTGEAHPAETFWRLFSDWCENNPPNQGPNWMCGQEATFRLMAVVFAAEAMGVAPGEQAGLARFVAATGSRISANLDYALSQKNNHGVSECVGLITAALLIPGAGESAGWLRRGLQGLEAQLRELVYADGGFAQHSLIYHRVLLHDLCWCRYRLLGAGREVPAWLESAGRRALEFLRVLVEPATGLAPLYGSNDGTNVLPLAEAEFADMRPVLQMAAAAFRGELLLPAGPWDEAAAWLNPAWSALLRAAGPVRPAQWYAPVAGCLQLTNGAGRLFMRCPERFRHRPSQADMLHVDVWHQGRPVALDGGSYSYNSSERFGRLGQAAFHNSLTIDGVEPMHKFNRFLYLPWPRGHTAEQADGSFASSHDGYKARGVCWTRLVSAAQPEGGFVVKDKVQGAAGHRLLWHWRLADGPWAVDEAAQDVCGRTLAPGYSIAWAGTGSCRTRLVRADAASAYGWCAPHYGAVEPACSLLIETDASADFELTVRFRPTS